MSTKKSEEEDNVDKDAAAEEPKLNDAAKTEGDDAAKKVVEMAGDAVLGVAAVTSLMADGITDAYEEKEAREAAKIKEERR